MPSDKVHAPVTACFNFLAPPLSHGRENRELQAIEAQRGPASVEMVERIRAAPRQPRRVARRGPSDHPWIVHQFAEKEGILTIANAVTGHFLALHEAQVGGFEKLSGEWVLRLNVQLKFEDGRLRVEWLPDEPACKEGGREASDKLSTRPVRRVQG